MGRHLSHLMWDREVRLNEAGLVASAFPRPVKGMLLRTWLVTIAGEFDSVLSLVFLVLSTLL